MQSMRPDDPWKRLRELQDKLDRYIAETRSSMRALGATTFSGNLTVADGGQITAEGPILSRDPETSVGAELRNGSLRLYSNIEDELQSRFVITDQRLGVAAPYYPGESPPTYISMRGEHDTTGNGTGIWNYSGGRYAINVQGRANITAPRLDLISGDLRFYELPTSSSSANVRLLEGGTPTIAWVTSSRRYKADIEDLDIPIADVLQLQPRTWRDKGEVEADPETTNRNIGFVAEEVAEVDSLRPLLVNDDEHGEPHTLNYDRFAAVQQIVIRDQQQRIDALEATVATLSARLDALED